MPTLSPLRLPREGDNRKTGGGRTSVPTPQKRPRLWGRSLPTPTPVALTRVRVWLLTGLRQVDPEPNTPKEGGTFTHRGHILHE